MAKAKAKEEYKQKMRDSEPVFRLKVINSDSVRCKYLGTIESRENICDEPMELSTGADKLVFKDIGKYNISARALTCNIPGTFMLKHKKYPLFYITFNYTNQLVGGCLFNLYFYITLTKECSDSLILPRHYVNKTMNGKFTVELVADEGFLTFAVNKMRSEYEKQVQTKYLDKFDTLSDEEKDVLDITINTEVEEMLDKLRKKFEPTEFNGSYVSKGKVLKQMLDIVGDESFDDLVSLCLDFRNHERQERMGSDRPIKIPKKVMKLQDFKDNPEKIDEYVNNMTSDSDDSSNSSDDEY